MILKDKLFFRRILRVFESKKQMTFRMTEGYISISAYDVQRVYLSLERELFEDSSEDMIFTINTQHLLDGLELLKDASLEVDGCLILRSDASRIKIPFVPTIEHEYEEIQGHTAKIVIQPEMASVLGTVGGLVTYEIENSRLYLRKIANEVIEEIEFNEVNLVETGELKFSCNNRWAEVLRGVEEYVESVMLSFSENYLCIQFLFVQYPKSYLELQIPRSVIN
jgi:hypothetical protein